MRAYIAFVVVLLAGCPRTLSQADRDALQDFRAVERACLARADEILRDESMHLTYSTELTKAIQNDLVDPWQTMRSRVKLEERHFGDALSTTLGRYFDERELAWESLAMAISVESSGMETTVNHRWQYRESNDAANTDQKIIDAKLAALKLPALGPPAVTPIVELDPPPPLTTPGAAYFLAGRNVVRLDDNGFRTIATDIDTMDVLPDGTMWACSVWHIAHWDGTHTTDYKPKIPSRTCTAGPDGVLWVLDDRYFDHTSDQLGRFDTKTWKIVPAVVGDVHMKTESMIADRDGHLYAVNRDSSGSSDEVFVLDKTWRQLALQQKTGRLYLNHLLRDGAGQVWATYDVSKNGEHSSTGFARLTPRGGEEPVYAADYFQAEQMYPFVDAAGVFTVVDPRRNMLVQAKKERKLPMPFALRWHDYDSAGPFAIDGAGRIWIDLVDGVNVIEKGGKRTVYPRGSIDGIRQNVKTIIVTGAGPTLVAPGAVATRTIKGQLHEGGKLELAMCADPWGRECPLGLPRWSTFSDAEGYFTFEKVPRWTFSIQGLTGLSGKKYWRGLRSECCADKDDLGELSFEQEAIY